MVTEAAAGGTDTVQAARSYTLGAELENLQLLGAASYSGTGNAGGNSLFGNAGRNRLGGLAGNTLDAFLDRLRGMFRSRKPS